MFSAADALLAFSLTSQVAQYLRTSRPKRGHVRFRRSTTVSSPWTDGGCVETPGQVPWGLRVRSPGVRPSAAGKSSFGQHGGG